MSVDTGVMLALLGVRFDGVTVEPGRMQEVRVQDSLALPAAFSITYAPADLSRGDDPLGVGTPKPKLGTAVEIGLGAPTSNATLKVFDGEITALEPNYGPDGIRLVVSGYARSHRLHRGRKTRTFQKMKASQIISKLAREAGLRAQVDDTKVTLEFVQQNNETDYEFVRRLASMYDLEALVDGKALVVRSLGANVGQELQLEYGENSSNGSATRLHSFYPRASTAQQVSRVTVHAWDPKQKQAVQGQADVTQLGSAIGIEQAAARRAFGNATLPIANAPVETKAEADALAASVAAYVGSSFVSAHGDCEGDPRIRAGTTLNIKGLGQEFSGKYRVSSVTHAYGGPTGYTSTFEVMGRLPRELVDLKDASTKNTWGKSLVVGIVSNHKDPDGLGRVRVKYPTIDGQPNEGAWARVLSAGAGKSKGQMMLPQVDDEVLVGFEGGDTRRPYVLGALWNGKDPPLVDHLNPEKKTNDPDGSYVLRSRKRIDMHAVDSIVVRTDKDMTVEVKGKSTETVDKEQEVTVKKTFKLDAADELTLVCGKSKIVLKKDGTITIEGGNVTMNGQTGTTVKGAKVDVQGSGQVSVQANGQLGLKGAQVAIN